MKILIDMNLSPDWVEVLRRDGFDSIHWSRLGDPRASGQTIMDWARANDHVVFTHDLDFSTVLAMTQARGPSVRQVRTQGVLPTSIADVVIRALRQFSPQVAAGAIVVVEPRRSCVRLLPIR